MTQVTIYGDVREYFDSFEIPEWHSEAVRYLRGGGDFGLYLYNLVKSSDISTVINIGTARGYSTVCLAKAFKDSNREGEVHTIDIVSPDEPGVWGPKSKNDPISKDATMRELIQRFHPPEDEAVPIRFHTGDSTQILNQMDLKPDLVFHDGEHTYETVKRDMQLATELGNGNLIQAHDDCFLYEDERVLDLFNPRGGTIFAKLPKLWYLKRYRYSIHRKKYPGIAAAVSELIDERDYKKVEVIRDDHAPITTIYE